jgi:hypothetical protein
VKHKEDLLTIETENRFKRDIVKNEENKIRASIELFKL